MKIKDWISLIAILLIVGIAALGEFISVQGDFALTAGNMWHVLPMAGLLTGAVLLGRRKGNHRKLFKTLSWSCYVSGTVLLFLSLFSFMHFFNVQDSSKRDDLVEKTGMVISDFDSLYDKYSQGVTKRRHDYEQKLSIAIANKDISTLDSVSGTQKSWEPKHSKHYADDWKESMLKTYNGYKNSFDSIKPVIYNAIIENFNILTAGGKFASLQELYRMHKRALSDEYSRQNPIERITESQQELKYNNHETKWEDAHLVLAKKEFGIAGFTIFIILAFFGSLTFLCIKDDTIRKPKMRTNVQNVYDAGHKL